MAVTYMRLLIAAEVIDMQELILLCNAKLILRHSLRPQMPILIVDVIYIILLSKHLHSHLCC